MAQPVIPTTTAWIVVAGMTVLAVVDLVRTEIEDTYTVFFLCVVLVSLGFEGVTPTQWVMGTMSATFAFGLYLALAMRGVFGGGDVKLAAVPALVFGSISPFIAVWWVATSILVQQGLFLITARKRRELVSIGATSPVALPHVPAMATSAVFATLSLTPLLGL